MYLCIFVHIEFLQGGSVVMLFDVMQESYVAGDKRQTTHIEGE